MNQEKPREPIFIKDGRHGLPYSKGMMASSIMATGLSPGKAYRIASDIDEQLRKEGKHSITMDELKSLTLSMLSEKMNPEYALAYQRWSEIGRMQKPVIVLVGGTTGVGKSTIATELAFRLGFNRIVSTDSIREVMRSFFSKELMPQLYNSTFDAYELLRYPLSDTEDPVNVGFRQQSQAVMVGIQAIVERAINERVNMIIEGAHILPGFVKPEDLERAFIVPIFIVVNDEEQHRNHFLMREVETMWARPHEKYLKNFDNIRKVQDYIKTLAKANNVPVFSSYNLDNTVSKALQYIMNSIFGAIVHAAHEDQSSVAT